MTHEEAWKRTSQIFDTTWIVPDRVTNEMKQQLALQARRCWRVPPSRFLQVLSGAARDQLAHEFPRFR